MPDYTKDITSTNMPANSISTSTQNGCALCPNLSTNLNNSSEYDNSPVLIELITKNISSVSELQKDVLNLEKEQEKSREFYKSISKLAKTSRIVLLFLIVVPIILKPFRAILGIHRRHLRLMFTAIAQRK